MSTRLPAFDVLVDLARNDPEALEELRLSLTTAVINGSLNEANKRRLQGLQFQVDMERERARTALSATIRISEMMCQSLADLHRSIVTTHEIELTEVAAEDGAAKAGPAAGAERNHGARILPFRPL